MQVSLELPNPGNATLVLNGWHGASPLGLGVHGGHS